MNPAFVVRYRPLGPWRIGPDSGARERVDNILHSDALFSAVTAAMLRVGRLEEWLSATVRDGAPAVRFSSLFPFLGDTLFVPPPRALWPPPPSARVRWTKARFVPLPVVKDLVSERQPNERRWYVDGPSECLLPEDAHSRGGPFRPVVRSQAGVDRLAPGAVAVHRTAALEFAEDGGFWGLAVFADEAAREQWAEPVRAALRLLADTGLGGERSQGWGRSAQPEMTEGVLPDAVLSGAEPPPPAEGEAAPETVYWLLSLFSPAEDDSVDWQRGSYSLVTRAGRVESPVRSGDAKKRMRMVDEGSVLVASAPPRGAAADVAPAGFPHPVYRAGFAVAVPFPMRHPERGASAL